MTMTDQATGLKDGRVVGIAGPVIDVEFPPNSLPELNSAVEFDVEVDGEKIVVLAEVAQQLGHGRVRAVCLKPTDGLKRGTPVRNLGHGIHGVAGDIEARLRDMGITTFGEIAAWTDEDMDRIDDHLGFEGRIQRDDWQGQARRLHNEKYPDDQI